MSLIPKEFTVVAARATRAKHRQNNRMVGWLGARGAGRNKDTVQRAKARARCDIGGVVQQVGPHSWSKSHMTYTQIWLK
jgi:hypothetical protein